MEYSEGLAMTNDALRHLYEGKPFVPFVIHLADGRNIAVPSREFLFLLPSGRLMIVAQPDDSFNIVDLDLVTDVQVKPSRKRVKDS